MRDNQESAAGNPLGEVHASPDRYSPDVLFPIARASAREAIGLTSALEMQGFDHWQAFELSWLDSGGKPQVAYADLFFSADSPSIVESKSLKLYLNSFNHERLTSWAALEETLSADLSSASGAPVVVRLANLVDYRARVAAQWQAPHGPAENTVQHLVNLDSYSLIPDVAPLDQSILLCEPLAGAQTGEQVFVSDLFRSNCPVTNQPDWASIEIRLQGVSVEPSSLLSYLCSFRNHQGYHEECAERIFKALSERCTPSSLRISMNYLRRGGLDINVYRASYALEFSQALPRAIRQ
jgi:7-cyano-7-deazaguanine reductase